MCIIYKVTVTEISKVIYKSKFYCIEKPTMINTVLTNKTMSFILYPE